MRCAPCGRKLYIFSRLRPKGKTVRFRLTNRKLLKKFDQNFDAPSAFTCISTFLQRRHSYA